VSDRQLIAIGWRITLAFAVVGGGALVFAVLAALGGMAWWGVLGYVAASAVALYSAHRIIQLNAILLENALSLESLRSRVGRNALDGEEDE
jgi:hypothetical protein